MTATSRRRLTRALATLDARTRVLLSLARLEGLEPTEIARVVRATPERVARDIAAAERTLRRSLREAADAFPERRRRA